MVICVKKTPKIAAWVSDVLCGGRSVLRSQYADTTGAVMDADGNWHNGPVAIRVYSRTEPGLELSLREDDIDWDKSEIVWSRMANRRAV